MTAAGRGGLRARRAASGGARHGHGGGATQRCDGVRARVRACIPASVTHADGRRRRAEDSLRRAAERARLARSIRSVNDAVTAQVRVWRVGLGESVTQRGRRSSRSCSRTCMRSTGESFRSRRTRWRVRRCTVGAACVFCDCIFVFCILYVCVCVSRGRMRAAAADGDDGDDDDMLLLLLRLRLRLRLLCVCVLACAALYCVRAEHVRPSTSALAASVCGPTSSARCGGRTSCERCGRRQAECGARRHDRAEHAHEPQHDRRGAGEDRVSAEGACVWCCCTGRACRAERRPEPHSRLHCADTGSRRTAPRGGRFDRT